jgi:hypothetical protein
LTRDLFSRKPTVITIMLGMNDAAYAPFDQPRFDTFKAGYQHIVDRIRKEAPDARVWLFRPSPYDDVTRPPKFEGGYNQVLLRYADFVTELAKANGFGVVDQNGAMVDMLTKINGTDPALAQHLIPDRVHPGWQADYLMAHELLDAWHATALTTDVSIDSSGHEHVQNAKITDFKTSPVLAWTETDAALPYFVPLGDMEMNAVLPFVEPVPSEKLTVPGLSAGSYHVRIDGKDVGSFNADQLAQGVDLARLDTPMFEQAAALRQLIDRRNDLFYQRWRQLDYRLGEYKLSRADAAKGALDRLDQELEATERELAKPKPHRFEIAPGG